MPLLDGRQAQRFADVGRLLLAVEALSPSTANNDRKQKRAVYQEEGVPLSTGLWIPRRSWWSDGDPMTPNQKYS